MIAHNALSKLIICFPQVGYRKWKDESLRKFAVNTETRLNRLRQAFAETSWSVALGRLDDAKSLRSLIFREGGGVTVVRARSRDRNAYNLAVVVAHWIIWTGWPDAGTTLFRLRHRPRNCPRPIAGSLVCRSCFSA